MLQGGKSEARCPSPGAADVSDGPDAVDELDGQDAQDEHSAKELSRRAG